MVFSEGDMQPEAVKGVAHLAHKLWMVGRAVSHQQSFASCQRVIIKITIAKTFERTHPSAITVTAAAVGNEEEHLGLS